MCDAVSVIDEVEARFERVFGRAYPGVVESYRADDADVVMVTLGSIAGLVREVVDGLRARGVAAGLVRIRYMRPFPADEIAAALASARAVGVLEKDVSFGAEGVVFSNVNSALLQHAGGRVLPPTMNFIGGLGGDDISAEQLERAFEALADAAQDGRAPSERMLFLGVDDVDCGGDDSGEGVAR